MATQTLMTTQMMNNAATDRTAPLAAGALVMSALVWGMSWWPFRQLHGYGLHPLWTTAVMYLLISAGLLLVHLGMSGSLSFARHLPPAGTHDHFEMRTTHGTLRLHDPRRFGAVVYADDEEATSARKLLGKLGMELGVLVVLNMMIGLIHPPFGMLLFVTKALTGIPIGEMMKEGWPFLLMLLLLLLAMTFFPQIVLWLPQTVGYVTH